MILILELFGSDTQKFTLFQDKKIISEEFKDKKNREMLSLIDSFLQKNHLTPKNLEAIVLVLAKASFTSARIATVIANTFAYVLNIKVLIVKNFSMNDLSKISEQIKHTKNGKYVSAFYSAKPNIN